MLCELPESTSTVRGKFPINPWNLSVWGEGDPVKAYGEKWKCIGSDWSSRGVG